MPVGPPLPGPPPPVPRHLGLPCPPPPLLPAPAALLSQPGHRPPQPRARPLLPMPRHRRSSSPPRLLCDAAVGDASSSAPAPRRLVLYTKSGWCLCDGLKEKLHAAVLLAGTPYSLASLELQERDITTNSEWERLYQYEIPVLAKVLPDGTEHKWSSSRWRFCSCSSRSSALGPTRHRSFNDIVFPSVALCYIGQVVYLRKFPHNVANTFYRSIPAPMFWPAFIVAILSGIITSQAMLSRAFAILSKALSLGCMPRVRVIHTLHRYEGQVYIPEVNFLMGLASILVMVAFRMITNIGHAYESRFGIQFQLPSFMLKASVNQVVACE
ncbi:hypothetical protein ZWY2020_044853 [Hordeum vulgare]|nr:hypothetical protein ZWY2020_044853 [Hordeum vulgare]